MLTLFLCFPFLLQGIFAQSEITQFNVEFYESGWFLDKSIITTAERSRSVDVFESHVLYTVNVETDVLLVVDQWFYSYDGNIKRRVYSRNFPLTFTTNSETVLTVTAKNAVSELVGVLTLSLANQGYGKVFYVVNNSPVVARQNVDFLAVWASNVVSDDFQTGMDISLNGDDNILHQQDDILQCETVHGNLHHVMRDWYKSGSILQDNNYLDENLKTLCTKTFELSFKRDGGFSLTATATYKDETLTTSTYSCVTRALGCPAPIARIRIDESRQKNNPTVGDSPLVTYTVNDVINMWGKVVREDCLQSGVQVLWFIYEMSALAGKLYDPVNRDMIRDLQPVALGNGARNPIIDEMSFALQPGSLQIGLYFVLFSYVEEEYCGPDSYFPADGIRIKIAPPPLTVKIDGGEYVEHPITSDQTDLQLRGELSKDQGVVLHWFCHIMNEDTKFIDFLKLFEQGQEEGCVECGCFKNGFLIDEYSSGVLLTIPNSKLSSEAVNYIFTVFAKSSDTNEHSQFQQSVKVYTPDKDRVNVISVSTECISNCDQKLTNPIQLRGLCVFGCSNLQLTVQQMIMFKWFLISPNNDEKRELQSSSDYTFDSDELQMPPHEFQLAGKYTVLFEVYILQLDSKQEHVLATSRYGFSISPGPTEGSCTIRPGIGEALVTQFVFECQGFNDNPNNPPLYRIEESEARISRLTATSTLPTVIYQGPESKLEEVYLPVGNKANGYRVKLTFVVSNQQGKPTMSTVYVVVKPPTNVENVTLDKFVQGPNSKLNRLITNGDIDGAVQVITALTSFLKQEQLLPQISEAVELLKTLNIIKVANLQKAFQISKAVAEITNLYLPDEVKLDRQEIITIYEKTNAVFGSVFEYFKAMKEVTEKSVIGESVIATLNVASNLAQILSKNSSTFYQMQEDLFVKRQDLVNIMYNISQPLTDPVEVNVDENEVIILSIAGNVGVNTRHGGLYSKNAENKSPISVSTLYYNPFEKVVAVKENRTDTINLPVIGISTLKEQPLMPSSRNVDSYDVLIPTRKNKTSLDLVSEAPDVKRVLLPRPCNFPISKNSSHIATPEHECGAAVVQFELDISTNEDRTKRQAVKGHDDVVAYIVLKPNKPCRIPNAPCIKASFVQALETEPCNNSTDNNAFCIRPKFTVLTVTLPAVSSNDELDEFQDDPWAIAATDDMLNKLGLDSITNNVILLAEDLQPDVLAKERDRNDTQSYQKVSVNVVKADCFTWNYDQKTWDAQECSQGRLLKGERLHCRCTSQQDKFKVPLLVAASFIIVPNQIDVKDLSDLLKRLHNNPYVILTNCLWVVVFLPFLVWARRKDASDKQDSHIFIPEDSDVTCEFFYEIVVFTGIINNAGTTARVTVVLRDSEGTKTEPHVINDVTEKTLNRGGVDTFLITSKLVLKDVQSVLIWHDNSGDQPAWYLERIAVYDLQNIDVKVPACFFVSKWLSLDLYPYTCKLELHKASQRQFLSFENAFKINFQSLFKEANVWTAPLHRTPCSTYTRVQRIACVMVAVFGCMVASIMFYDTSDTEAYSVAMGYISFNFSTFISSAEAAILLSPVNFLITFIFRNLKPPKHVYEHEDSNISNERTSLTDLSASSPKTYEKLSDDVITPDDVTAPRPSSMFKGVREKHTRERYAAENDRQGCSKDNNSSHASLTDDDVETLHGVVLSENERVYSLKETEDEWTDAVSEAPSHMLITLRSIKELAQQCSTSELRSHDVDLNFDRQKTAFGYDSTVEEYNSQYLEGAGFLDDSYSETSEEDFFLDGPEVTKVSDHLFSRKFVKVAWFFVMLHLIGCSTVTILYGLQYESDKFFEWLFSFLLSVLQNLFVVSPMRITLTAAVMASAKGVYAHQWSGFHGNHARADALVRWRALQSRDWEQNRDRVRELIASRRWCYDIPEFDRLARAGHLKVTIAHVKKYWRETVCWVLMATFVTSLVVLQRDPRVFRLDQRVREYFADDFYEIGEANDVYDFLENLVPTLYNDDKEYEEDDFKLLGPIRIRQVRLKPQPCPTHINTTFRSKCKIPDLYVNSLAFYDSGSYSQEWKPDKHQQLQNESLDFFGKDLWQYTRVEPFYGTKLVFGNSLIRPVYPIGGYVADLGYSSDDIIPVIRGMKNTNWIDYRSAALFIEFSIFTPSFRHVSSVILGIEFLAVGGVNLCLEIYHYKPIYFYSFKDLILSMCQIFHVFVNVLILADLLQQCRKDHWRRERALEVIFDVWNFICLLTIFLTTFAYYLYLQHVVNALQVSGMYHADPGRYVPFGTPAYYQRFYFVVLAVAAFFSYVRVLKVFRGSRIVSLMIQTLYLAHMEVASLTFIFVVFLICFAHVGVISFAVDKYAFNNFWFTCVNLFQLAGGMDTEHPDIVTTEVWWSIYFCLFMTLVLMIFVNFYAVVLSDAHNNMKGTRYDDHKHPVETLAVAWLYEKLLLLCGVSSKHFRDKYAKIHVRPDSKLDKEVFISPIHAPLNATQHMTDAIKSILAKKATRNLTSKSVHFQIDSNSVSGRGSRARAKINQSKISKKKVHDRGPLIEDIRRLLMTYCRR